MNCLPVHMHNVTERFENRRCYNLFNTHTHFDITFCLWLYMSCRSLCCNFFNETE